MEPVCGTPLMRKSQSLPRIPGAKRQTFPKIRVVPLHDANHIALREKRLGIQLTEKPRKLTPEEVFAEIDQMFAKQSFTREEDLQEDFQERKLSLDRNLTFALESTKRSKEAGAMLQNDVPEPKPPEPELPPTELFQTLDDLTAVESPSRSSKTTEGLEQCAEQLATLIEKVAHIDGVLQRDIESTEVIVSEVEDTPAEVVAKNPGPALLAAREAPTLFKELDSHIPRSKLKAYDVLLRAGAVEVHRYVEENMNSALSRRDEGCQWVSKVLNRKDRNPPGHSSWCKRALQKLEGEREDRRIQFGLGPDNPFG